MAPQSDIHAVRRLLLVFLGVSQDADKQEIKRAWREKLNKHHPDRPIAQVNGRLTFPQKAGETDEAYEARLPLEINAVAEAYTTAKSLLLLREDELTALFAAAVQEQSVQGSHFAVQPDSEGNIYAGEINAQGLRQGKGVYTWSNGERYEGGWLDGEMTGPGTYSWPDGRIYKGFWMMSEPCGRGTLYHPDGSTEEWECINGEFKAAVSSAPQRRDLSNVIALQRSEKIKFTSEASYDGEVDEYGRFDGQGVYRWKDGTSYKGSFVEGKISGFGVLTWEDGSTYEGFFVEGMREGEGIMRWASGAQEEREYKNGQLFKSGPIIWSSRSTAGRPVWAAAVQSLLGL